jgi:pimeloyl-ACP methyl ester carboxylesterase
LPLIGSLLFKQALGRRLFHRFFQQRVYAPGHNVPSERIDAFFDAFNSPTAREGAHSVIRAMLDTRPAVARLSRLKAPTLLVWGRADSLYSPQDGPKLSRQIPNAHLEFIDSGHSPHEEQPDKFVEHVQRFLLGQRP